MRPDIDSNAVVMASPDPQLLKRLQKMPDVAAPPYGYAEFTRRYSRRRAHEAQRPMRLLAIALAVLVCGWVVKHGFSPLLGTDAMMADSSATPGVAPPNELDAPPEDGVPPAVLLPTVNAETWLSAHPQHAIVRVPTQMAVGDLEDQIAAMDDQLNAERLSATPAQQVTVLQRDRAQLIESLAQVRYAQNLMAGLP